MFPVEAFSNTVGKFVEIAHSLELPFHLTGSSISSAYGEPRLTQDIDIVISPDVARQRANDLVAELASSDFLFSEETVRQGGASGELFNYSIRAFQRSWLEFFDHPCIGILGQDGIWSVEALHAGRSEAKSRVIVGVAKDKDQGDAVRFELGKCFVDKSHAESASLPLG